MACLVGVCSTVFIYGCDWPCYLLVLDATSGHAHLIRFVSRFRGFPVIRLNRYVMNGFDVDFPYKPELGTMRRRLARVQLVGFVEPSPSFSIFPIAQSGMCERISPSAPRCQAGSRGRPIMLVASRLWSEKGYGDGT